jgi:DNA polymerase III alpha subunit (gram-positive type)
MDNATKEYTAYVGDDIPLGLMRLAEADIVVGHYFKKYDAPVIKKLTEGLVVIDEAKIDDTVELSRILFPELENHKLATWGDIMEFPKLDHKEWDRFSEEMLVYLERDVRLNDKLYDFFIERIAEQA